MKRRMFWFWAAPAAAGVALIVVAALLSSSSPAGPVVPAANAADDAAEYCVLQIDKEASESEIEAGGRITYTITVKNIASAPGEAQATGCINPVVTDVLSDDLECVSASVSDADNLVFDQEDITDSCENNDVEWAFTGSLQEGDQVVLKLRVETDEDLDEGDRVRNEACVTANAVVEDDGVDQEEVGPVCGDETVRVRERRVVEPTATATSTPVPPTPTPVVIVVQPTATPTVKPLATLAPPSTGTGSDGGSPWLPLGLGVSGACLVIFSAGMFARRRLS
jgi:uncharacterized repeat protein (TIGR01451 family)